ncbi:MAG: hypothetical protein PHC61_14225 [Chitinivibrionales bacterium]|nr:hypothetical protein [Chitinivibrionales bacterium]
MKATTFFFLPWFQKEKRSQRFSNLIQPIPKKAATPQPKRASGTSIMAGFKTRAIWVTAISIAKLKKPVIIFCFADII